VIVFSDVRPWMIAFQSYSKLRLVDFMLHYCGLPPWLTQGDNIGATSIVSCLNDPYLMHALDQENLAKVRTLHQRQVEKSGDNNDSLREVEDPFAFASVEAYDISYDMLFGRNSGEWAFPFKNL